MYRIKPDGTYKSRWVIRGFEQYIDPWESTRAAVVHGTTTRILLTLAAMQEWKFTTADIKNAFLNGQHKDRYRVYLQMPIGYSKKNTIYDVQKSIYGLKTAAII